MTRRIRVELTELEAKAILTAISATYNCCDGGEHRSTFGAPGKIAAVARAQLKVRTALYPPEGTT